MIDKVRGVLFGKALGDALGIPYESRSASAIKEMFKDNVGPFPLVQYKANFMPYRPGEWSDDAAQAVCIVNAYLRGHDEGLDEIDVTLVAEEFLRWANTDGRGMGNLTSLVFANPDFREQPIEVAETVWAMRGGKDAPNGAVMRGAVVGLFRPYDIPYTAISAATCAKVTHADPRCIASAIAVAVFTAGILTGMTHEKSAILAAEEASVYYDVTEWVVEDRTIESLLLDEGMAGLNPRRAPIGYTFKTLGAAFWAAREVSKGMSFEQMLQTLFEQGGDVDTNAAAAGALAGAIVGYESLPQHLVSGLVKKKLLLNLSDRIVGLYAPTDGDTRVI